MVSPPKSQSEILRVPCSESLEALKDDPKSIRFVSMLECDSSFLIFWEVAVFSLHIFLLVPTPKVSPSLLLHFLCLKSSASDPGHLVEEWVVNESWPWCSKNHILGAHMLFGTPDIQLLFKFLITVVSEIVWHYSTIPPATYYFHHHRYRIILLN